MPALIHKYASWGVKSLAEETNTKASEEVIAAEIRYRISQAEVEMLADSTDEDAKIKAGIHKYVCMGAKQLAEETKVAADNAEIAASIHYYISAAVVDDEAEIAAGINKYINLAKKQINEQVN